MTRHSVYVVHLLAWLLFALVALPAGPAAAGGLILHDRGARALGRGYALVAGVDDPSAVFYNPAALIDTQDNEVLADLTLTLLDADFTRVDSGGRTLEPVQADPVPLPIPTLAYAHSFGLRDFRFGLGVSAPSSPLLRWPADRYAAQRYGLISLEGTILVEPTLGIAWQTPLAGLSVGLSPGLVVGAFQARMALSACDGAICTQPENPDYDALAEINSGTLVRPVATLGVLYEVWKLRLGLSVTTPYDLGQQATLRVRPPSAAIFQDATVVGDTADFTLQMPWRIRAGIEGRPLRALRVELSAVLETWSQQEAINIVPQDVRLEGVEAVGDYEVGPITLPRKMRDTVSVRLGGEFEAIANLLTVRAGVGYEPSAFRDRYRSVLTVDAGKWLLTLGGSLQLGDLLLDAGYGLMRMSDATVSDTGVYQQNPIRPAAAPVPVGNGTYTQSAHILSVGLRYKPR